MYEKRIMMNAKRVWSGILAAIVMTGMVQFMTTVPIYADEGTASAVSYVDIYSDLLDELAPIAVGMFSDGPDYHKYGLYDMTGDGIKELIVYHEGDYEDQIGYYVYTWDGTQVVQCQEKILYGDRYECHTEGKVSDCVGSGRRLGSFWGMQACGNDSKWCVKTV